MQKWHTREVGQIILGSKAFQVSLRRASRAPLRAIVDSAFPLDKSSEWLRGKLVRQGVPEGPRPLRPGALIHLLWIGGAADYCGECFLMLERIHTPELQGLVSSFEGALFDRPPRNEIENRTQIPVDRIPIPAGLALLPSVSNPQQVLPQHEAASHRTHQWNLNRNERAIAK